MAIYRLIANGSFGPDEIKVMTAAYEAALIDLGITNRDDPITELIAKAIVNVLGTGERNPLDTKVRALNALGLGSQRHKPEAGRKSDGGYKAGLRTAGGLGSSVGRRDP